MLEAERKRIDRLKRYRHIRLAEMISYNGVGAPGTGHGCEQWCYADGSIVRNCDVRGCKREYQEQYA